MEYVSVVKNKYDYLTNEEAEYFVNRAKSFLIDQLFPTNYSISYLTYVVPARFDMWILDCVDELIQRDGVSSLTAYKENGVQMTWDRSGLSSGLLQRVQRVVGTVN